MQHCSFLKNILFHVCKKSNKQPLAKAQNDYSLVVGLRNRLKFGNVNCPLTSNSSILGDGETFSPPWGLVSVQSR